MLEEGTEHKCDYDSLISVGSSCSIVCPIWGRFSAKYDNCGEGLAGTCQLKTSLTLALVYINQQVPALVDEITIPKGEQHTVLELRDPMYSKLIVSVP